MNRKCYLVMNNKSKIYMFITFYKFYATVYKVRYKLYELEELLPEYFMRISKSTILNTNKIYSISKNLTASSIIEFQNTHKKAYVSRHYYKQLNLRLLEGRNGL